MASRKKKENYKFRQKVIKTNFMHLIVLASGKGSRLGQLTKDKPKCFLKVDGKYIIEHLAPIFEHFEKVFIVVGHKKDE